MYFRSRKYFFSSKGKIVKAVDGVSLQIKPGMTLGLVGESGCGKSTLGRCVVRLLEPTAGQIFFGDSDLLSLKGKALLSFRRRLQMVFQNPMASLNPRMTVGEAITEALVIHRIGTKSERASRVAELLESVGMSPTLAQRFPHELSGGQRQRVGIARALAVGPELIIADEPVSALDVSIQGQIINLLLDLQERLGLAYLFISHDLDVVAQVSDTVAVMYLGKIVERVDRIHLCKGLLHPYSQHLLASVPGRPAPVASGSISWDRAIVERPQEGCSFHSRCPRARQVCRRQEPALIAVDENRLVACHFGGIEHLPAPACRQTGQAG